MQTKEQAASPTTDGKTTSTEANSSSFIYLQLGGSVRAVPSQGYQGRKKNILIPCYPLRLPRNQGSGAVRHPRDLFGSLPNDSHQVLIDMQQSGRVLLRSRRAGNLWNDVHGLGGSKSSSRSTGHKMDLHRERLQLEKRVL